MTGGRPSKLATSALSSVPPAATSRAAKSRACRQRAFSIGTSATQSPADTHGHAPPGLSHGHMAGSIRSKSPEPLRTAGARVPIPVGLIAAADATSIGGSTLRSRIVGGRAGTRSRTLPMMFLRADWCV